LAAAAVQTNGTQQLRKKSPDDNNNSRRMLIGGPSFSRVHVKKPETFLPRANTTRTKRRGGNENKQEKEKSRGPERGMVKAKQLEKFQICVCPLAPTNIRRYFACQDI
jgi:hypothetical protein